MPGSGCFDFNIPLPTSLLQLIEAELAAERLSAGGEGCGDTQTLKLEKKVSTFSFSTLVPTFQLITHTDKVFQSVSESLFSAPIYIFMNM